ncbi:hypothetical protein HOG98_09005 [bacterium]|jgi:hypothetical protein|nr:hypothetical protein [bacterium]
MKLLKQFIITIFISLFLTSFVYSNTTPMQITFQATLSSSSQGLINGRYPVTVQLLNGSTQLVWYESFDGVLFVNGTFSIILGADPTSEPVLTATMFDIENPRFKVLVKLDSSEEHVIFPLPSAPYAIQAKLAEEVKEVKAERVSGTFISTVNIQNDLVVGDSSLFVDTRTNKVGVGHLTPNYTLDVKGSINATDFKINGEDIESILSWKKRDTGDLYYTDGFVGIGTSNPQYHLETIGTVNAAEYYIDGKPLIKELEGILSWKVGKNSYDIFFNDGTDTGNVGIGVTTPKELLHVNGGIIIGETKQTGTPEAGSIQYKSSDFLGYTGSNWESLTGIQPSGIIETNEVAYWTGTKQLSGSSLFKWDAANSYLGVGTENPTARLDIHEISSDTENVKLLQVKNSNNETLFVVDSENVGVGTSTPEFNLDVNGIINANDFRIGGKPIQTQLLAGTYWSLENYDRIFYDLGNVGIGTSQPNNLLEIASPTGSASMSFDIGGTDLFTLGIEESNPEAFVISKGGDLSIPVFTFKGEKIGVGLSNPEANLHVSGNTGVVIQGSINSEIALPSSGKGTRMMFFPAKAAFRAGTVEGTEWDNINIGTYSIAMGYGGISSGEGSAILGGYKNTAEGDYSVVPGGRENQALGDYSFAAGYRAVAAHKGSFVWADYDPTSNANFESGSSNQFVIKASNGVGIGTSETSDAVMTIQRDKNKEYLFKAIGNNDGKNALVVNTSGNVGIGTSDPGTARLAIMNGNFGIGTVTPNAPLTIRNTSPNQYLLYTEGYSVSNTPSVFVVTSSGNVGIGTTTPTERLTVVGKILGTSFQIVDPDNPDATITLQPNPGSPWADPSKSDGNTHRSQGLIGIGTPSPNSLLELSNRSGKDPIITFDLDGVDKYSMGVTQDIFSIQPGSGLFQSSPVISIGSENIGIGTYDPSTNLHVVGDSILEGKVAVGTTNVSSIYSMLVDGPLNIENDLYIQDTKFEPKESPWKTEGLNIYYISGNVGIGVLNPSVELEVDGIISANTIVLNDNLDIGGYLTADNLRLMDTSSNISEASGNLYVEDGELWYQSPINTLKKISSPLKKEAGDIGFLAFWTGEESIGESGIAWDNNNKKLDVSGNFNLNNSFVDGGFSVTNSVSMGAPTALNIQSSIKHNSIQAQTKNFTGHQINVDIEKKWGIESGTVTVKGLDIKASQSATDFFLNNSSFIGLNVDVSGVQTSSTGKVAAAIFKGGNVGINVDDPSVALEIAGTVSANYFNLNDSLSVPEIAIGIDTLVVTKSITTNLPVVGIGTTTPSTQLEVVGTISANNLIVDNGITATTANIGDGTFYINEFGNIGIGTTNPNLYGQLEINKSIEAPLGADFTVEKVAITIDGAAEDSHFFLRKNITGLDINVESNSNSNKLANEKTATGIKIDTSSLSLEANATAIGLNIDVSGTGGTRYAGLFNGGFVGIGTRTPNAELHVSGNIIADNLFLEGNIESDRATFNYLVVNESTILNGSVTMNELHVLNNITANSLVLLSELKVSTASLSSLDVDTASVNQTIKTVELIVSNTLSSQSGLFSTGVGIGVLSAPVSGLLVSGNVTANSIDVIDSFIMTDATFNVNEGSLFVGANSPYVGLGTTTPTAPLHLVYTNSSSYSAINNQSWNSIKVQTLEDGLGRNAGLLLAPHSSAPSSTVGSGIVAIKSSNSEVDFGSHLAFITDPLSGDSSEAMRLTDTGYLGIGTTTPQTNLDIIGNMAISGNLTVSNITLDKISNSSGITITGNGNLIFETTTSFNQNLKTQKGLHFYEGDTPSALANYGQLYVNKIDSDLYYMKESGTSVNLTNAFTGEASKIPFFDSSNSLSDEAALYWIDESNLLKVGTGNSLTKFEIVTTMNDTTTGNYNSHHINMSVSKRTVAPTSFGDNKFTGLNIVFESEDPTSEYQFGRLAENEIGIGLNVDVSQLIAKGFSNSSSTTLKGYKYAASFKGGNVGIGTSLPNAALHIVSEEAGESVFRVDTLDHSGTPQLYSLFVTANGYVGIGTSSPESSLEVKGINDSIGSSSLHVKNNSGNSLFYVQNNGFIGIGTSTPTESLDVAGTISANIGSFGEILGTTLNITNSNGNPSFFVNRDGQVGIGTTNPDAALNLSKTFSTALTAPYTQQKMDIEIAGSSASNKFYFQQDITGYDINFKVNNAATDILTGTATGISINMSQLEFGDNTTAIGLNVDVSSNATSKYAALLLGGNVGIGTSTPESTLEIIGTLNASSLIITDTLTAQNATFNELVVESTASFNGSITINALYANTISANTISMTGDFLANTGSFTNLTAQTATFNSLGIGVDSPAASLDVSGGSIFTGGVTINGSLDVAIISGNSGITINPTGMVNFVGITSFNSDVKIETALYLKPGSTPATDANYGILFTDENNSNSLVYKYPTGSTVNISSMYSGTAGVIPYFGDSEFKDDADFTYDSTNKIIKIGSSDNLTSLAHEIDIDDSVTGEFIGQKINLEFTSDITSATKTFYGMNIELLGQDPESLDDFGRLAAGETAIGLKVDLTTLKAGQSDADGNSVGGTKIAAQFLGGSVGIGTSRPEAALHVRNDDAKQPNIPVFKVDMESSGVYSDALLVSANGYVGIGISMPEASLDIKGKTDTDTTYSLIAQNNSGNPILAIRNDKKVGVHTLEPSSNLHIVSNGTTEIPLIINSGTDYSLVVTMNGFVGVGTSLPLANLHIENIDSSTDPFLVDAASDYAFIVKADGKVGIGTSTPEHGLHVNGLIESAANSGSLVTLPSFFDWTSTRGFITRTDSDLVYLGLKNQEEDGSGDFDSLLLWGNNSNPVNDLIFENTNSVGTSERLRITATGNIGINEPAPEALVHISKKAATNHIFKVDKLDGTTALIVSNNGFIGIGTDVPSASLHIAGSLEAESILLTQGGISVSTVNISNSLYIDRAILLADELDASSITGQKINLSIGRDTQKDVIGIDINISSEEKGGIYDPGFKYAVYGDAAAYGIKIDMRDLEVRDPAGASIEPGNNGGKYAAVFMGGSVGIGTTRPAHLLEVRQPDAGAIARFSSAYSEMTIHDYKNGIIGFEMEDAADEATHNVLTLAKNKVGIGTSNPDKTLVVNGDVRVGALRTPSGTDSAETSGDGNKLFFSGAPDVSLTYGNDNGDPMAMFRHNAASGESELRVQVSSYNTTAEADENDKFVVGYMNQDTYNPILSVQMDGHVGIYDGQSGSVSQAEARLHVTGKTSSDAEDLDDHIMVIQNTGGSLADSLALHHVTNGTDIVPNAKYVTFKTNLATLGTIEGNSNGTGVRFTTYGADYAEYLVKENKIDSFETGDIVGVVNGIISKKTENAQQALVKSSNPGVAGNWPGDDKLDDYELVAFFGQISVKVQGNVEKGQYILPSGKNDGVGIALSKEEIPADMLHLVVGRAWESADGDDINLIKAAVGFNFSVPNYYSEFSKVEELEKNVTSLKEEQNSQFEKLYDQLKNQDKTIETLLKKLNQIK